MISFAIGLLAALLFQMGTIAALQGPLALWAGGVDLSWLTGMVAAGASYAVLYPLCGPASESLGARSKLGSLSSEP